MYLVEFRATCCFGAARDTGVVYKVQPEKGGHIQTLYRNVLKVYTAEVLPPANKPAAETQRLNILVFYGFLPTAASEPAQHEEPSEPYEDPTRRSKRVNLGQPPLRYRD